MTLTLGILLEYPTLNGGEQSLLAVLDQLTGSIDVTVFAPATGPVADALRARNIAHVPLPDHWRNPEILFQFLQSDTCNVLHANSLTMSRHLAQVAPQLKCPCTGHVRDIMKLSASVLSDLRQLNRLICVSNAARAGLVEQGVDTSRLTIVHNGIDLQVFRPTERTGWLHRELGLPSEARLVVNIGQICLRKGLDTFAQVAVRLASRFNDLHFVHVGERHSTKAESIEYDQRIDEAFSAAGMQSRWHRLGKRNDVRDILNEADLLLHTARQEPLGRVLLEASALAVPIVATNVGGTTEIIEAGVTGLLAERDDIEGLTNAATKLLGDRALAIQIGQAARNRSERLFTASRAATETLAVWQSAHAADTLSGRHSDSI